MSQQKPVSTPPPTVNLTDIYHVLFRHKWKIVTVWLIGLAAAVALKLSWPRLYQSEAELYVRYVLDKKYSSPEGSESSIKTPDQGGESVLNSEVQILTSFDLALKVAGVIGPEKILAKAGGGRDLNRAALLIQRGLTVSSPQKSDIILLVFQHPDPEVVQPVLSQLISSYLEMHAKVHQATGLLDEILTQQTDQLHAQLTQAEDDLKKAKAKIGVMSLEETKKAYTERIAKIEEALDDAKAELAARQATLSGMAPGSAAPKTTTNATVETSVPGDKQAEYNRVSSLLFTLRKIEQERLLQFKPESSRVQEIEQQIAENQKIKDQLEKQFPQLAESRKASQPMDNQPVLAGLNPDDQTARVKELQSKVAVLEQQLSQVRKEAAALTEVEATITDLQRTKDLLEEKYRHYSANLSNARFDEAVGSPNIYPTEKPVPPVKAKSKLIKLLLMVVGGSFAGGIALAFAIEFYLDRSFKRPLEVEKTLEPPLFISIPKIRLNGNHGQPAPGARQKLLQNDAAGAQNGADAKSPPVPNLAPRSRDHRLQAFFDTLRDRLVMYFDMHNLTHKPKLVAVTSCAEGSGVSTVASGLAASLSETGDGNVLLVAMNSTQGGGAAHHYYKGNLAYDLDDALEAQKRDGAMVHNNLYVVAETANAGGLPQILHKRFSSLLPKLRASDYDYIIFDLPPVSQISPTTRLARFMDMVFMIVEAEKTDRDVVKRATELLSESQSNVGIVLNKHRRYVPRWLQQDL